MKSCYPVLVTRALPRWLIWPIATLLVAVLAGVLAGRVVEHRALDTLGAGAHADAKLRAALLDSEIARYRLLVLALAEDHDIAAGLTGGAEDRRRLDHKLETLAQATGAAVIYVVGPSGSAIAASNWNTPVSFVGRQFRFRRYFVEAMAHGGADQFARGIVSGHPGLFLARRTVERGVVVVKLEFPRIEAEWRNAGGITHVVDRDGVALVTSRPAWLYGMSRPLSPAVIARAATLASIDPAVLKPLPVRTAADGRGVIVDARRYVTATAPTSEPGWTLTLLRPAGSDLMLAWRTAAAGTALAVIALSALLWAWLGRRARARRRTTELEQAVAERTADLLREMEVRAASEARAADLREGLRQANRLASLGQITASVAHETAQPIAAIRTYSQTSETLLDRGDEAAVRANLAAIRRLADRIGSVTAELRGFARRGTGELRAVPLAEVIDGAVLILREQLGAVRLDLPRIPAGLQVLGGRVRLEQVLVNLLQNAIEAMRDRPGARIRIAIEANGEQVTMTVTDNGPGIPAEIADRLFTPFVTSRTNGLGLGLVIAQDIMADLGGRLRLVDSDGGAAFEIVMRRA